MSDAAMDGAALRRLLDEQAIRTLAARYSDAVTRLDPVAAAALYAEDGRVAIAGHETCGRPAIEAGMRASFAAFRLLQLIAHGGLVEVDGARARWSTVELAVRAGSDALAVIFGRYEDELARSASGWRFRRRRFTMAGRARVATSGLQLDPAFFAATIGQGGGDHG